MIFKVNVMIVLRFDNNGDYASGVSDTMIIVVVYYVCVL